MSLKLEIETWMQALSYYDRQEYGEALDVFFSIAETSKILFNCGVIYATIGEHEQAVQCYQKAVECDQYLAIAYFQEGVSNFLLGDFEEAMANFNDTLLYLRGNTFIDYEQLGLKFRLFSCEVLFNRGLCYIYLRQMGPGMQDIEFASREKVTADHRVIDEAIQENAENYTVFSIPVGVVYRPNEAKVKNLGAKNYLGKAKLIATAAGSSNSNRKPGRPSGDIPHAATKLQEKNMHIRKQSDPQLNNNLFPPTPPPDLEKIAGSVSNNSSITNSLKSIDRTSSVRAQRPPRLDLHRIGASLFQRPGDDGKSEAEKPRTGLTRTASEVRGPPHSRQGHTRGFSHDTGKQILYQENNTNPKQSWGYDDTSFAPPENNRINRSASSLGHRSGMSTRRNPYYIEEEEFEEDNYENDTSIDSFEMMVSANGKPQQQQFIGSQTSRKQINAQQAMEIRRFRIKSHAFDETRYVMIDPSITFGCFEGKIRDKFGFRSDCKLSIKTQDDGDMITMGDQEDLDLVLGFAREAAEREGTDMGKLEIWLEERV